MPPCATLDWDAVLTSREEARCSRRLGTLRCRRRWLCSTSEAAPRLRPRRSGRSSRLQGPLEEFVNAFDYGYEPPRYEVFDVSAEAFPSPNRQSYHVLHLGLKGREVRPKNRKPANLVFTIDVSGSMASGSRLELVKRGLHMLVDELHSDDRVGIVIYGTAASVVLEPTLARHRPPIQ